MATFYFIWIIRKPDLVEREKISNPNPKNQNIRPDWAPKSGSCTPLSGRSGTGPG